MGHFKHPSSCSNTQPNLVFFFFFFQLYLFIGERQCMSAGEGQREGDKKSSHQVPAASSAQLTRTLAYI